MNNRWWSLGFAALLTLVLLAGCGGSGANGSGGNGSGGGSSQASAEAALNNVVVSETPLYNAFVSTAYASIGTGGVFPALPVVLPSPLNKDAAPLAVYAWDCSGVQASGDLSDPDDDGIPANGRYQGSCTVTETGTGTFSWHLDLSIQDVDNTDPKAGFTSSGNVSWELQGKWKIEWSASEHSVRRNQSGGYDLTYEGGWAYTDYSDSSNDGSINYNLDGTWTPDDPNASFEDVWTGPGTLAMNGKVSASNDCAVDANFSFNLHFNGDGCADRGQISYSGNDCQAHSCNVTASWSSCNGPYQASGGCQ